MILQGTVTASGLNGDGLVIVEGEKHYVPFTVPGDKVEFEVIKQKRFQRLDLLSVLEQGPERSVPPCEHFSICGGCKLQHFSENYYHNFKVDLARKALDFHGVEALDWQKLAMAR